MNQKHMLVGLIIFVLLSFGGIIALEYKNKQIAQDDRKPILGDNWGNKVPVIPDKPNKPKPNPIENKHQITARSYKDAIKKSEKEGVPVLVFFEADWCGWCKKMKRDSLTDKDVKEIMKNYILVLVDYDRNKSVARRFGVRSIPSYVITNAKERRLKSGNGYLNADRFHKWLDNPSMYNQPKK